MVVTFFGHTDFCGTESQKEKIFEYLNALTEGKPAEMYLGGYGGFDRFAHGCCKRYQALCRGISLIFVSPFAVLRSALSRFSVCHFFKNLVFVYCSNSQSEISTILTPSY